MVASTGGSSGRCGGASTPGLAPSRFAVLGCEFVLGVAVWLLHVPSATLPLWEENVENAGVGRAEALPRSPCRRAFCRPRQGLVATLTAREAGRWTFQVWPVSPEEQWVGESDIRLFPSRSRPLD